MGQRWTLTMVDRQCKGSSLGPGGPQPYPHHNPPPFTPVIHLSSRLYQTHISLLQTFVHRLNPLSLRSPSRSVPNTRDTIHPLNQPTIIHPFHMTKPSQHTFIFSLIYPFLHTT